MGFLILFLWPNLTYFNILPFVGNFFFQKLCSLPHFPNKRLYSFLSSGLKMIMPPKNNFSWLFWNFFFFWKLLNERHSKPKCLQRRLYRCLLADAPSPQNDMSSHKWFFARKYCFFRKICLIIKHPLPNSW